MLGAMGLFYITALCFDALTSRAAVHQLFGESEESQIPEEYRSIVTSPAKVTTPRAAASLVFLHLAGLAGVIALTGLWNAIFGMLGIFFLVVFWGGCYCVFGTVIALAKSFSIGGTLFGIFVVGILAVELISPYLFIWFIDRRFFVYDLIPSNRLKGNRSIY